MISSSFWSADIVWMVLRLVNLRSSFRNLTICRLEKARGPDNWNMICQLRKPVEGCTEMRAG